MKVNFEEKHIKWGITIFLVVICSIAVFFIVFRFNALQKVAGTSIVDTDAVHIRYGDGISALPDIQFHSEPYVWLPEAAENGRCQGLWLFPRASAPRWRCCSCSLS